AAQPCRHRDTREQPQPRDLTIGGLTLQLEPQRPLRAIAFGFGLLPFEIEPPRVALEGLSQRRDDDAGEARLEPSRRACTRFELQRLFFRWRRRRLAAARK